jgi:hypothetical protein
MPNGKLWAQRDRFGNDIYLTYERWQHIIDPDNHPELEPYFDDLRQTIQRGRGARTCMIHIATSITRRFQSCRMTTPTSSCAFVFDGPLNRTAVYTQKSLATAYVQSF